LGALSTPVAVGSMNQIDTQARRLVRRSPWYASLSLLAVLAFSAPAAADLPPDPPPTAGSAVVANAASTGDGSESAGPAQNATPMTEPVVTPRSNRWLYTSLLVAGFLVFAGVVGANDRLNGDAKPKSKRPANPLG